MNKDIPPFEWWLTMGLGALLNIVGEFAAGASFVAAGMVITFLHYHYK